MLIKVTDISVMAWRQDVWINPEFIVHVSRSEASGPYNAEIKMSDGRSIVVQMKPEEFVLDVASPGGFQKI